MEKLPIKCECNDETEKKNVVKQIIDGKEVDVEYFLYCKKCGKYLGAFEYGHWEY